MHQAQQNPKTKKKKKIKKMNNNENRQFPASCLITTN